MISAIVFGVFVVVVAGPKAVKNIMSGTHDYADGFSVGYKKDGAKYKDEMYKK